MFLLKNCKLIGYFLLLLLSTCAINSGVLAARLLQEVQEKPQQWSRIPDEGFFASINREVPSSPDPLHNR
ncbi:hypothetical protein DCAR_0623973 [Daucus carota subsp. sativus]|uniref:Uncharacterized protein n=1 Tax=Daucus carota subsp. sativus TaxID=79200 RepID=A0A164VJV3_DAUCS|nr:hypothetical protein DCAR_0623973 [Daucus carota subsp. sativus]